MTGKKETEAAVIKRVSRKHGDDAHGGGAWKVAFADFCLALMCLFLVMWVMAAREEEQLREWMQAAGGDLLSQTDGRKIESMGGPRGSLIEREALPKGDGGNTASNDAPAQPSKKRYESPQEMQELAQTLIRLSEQAGLAANLQAVITAQGLRIMLHDTDKNGMFDRGSAIVNERFRALLRRMGPIFAMIENQLLIVGHTDSVPFLNRASSAYSNWTLSSQRAMAARVQLLEGGMPTDGILQVVGMADRAPLNNKDPRAGLNRRIEFLVLTSDQAQAVAAMFGMPLEVTPLIDGVDTVRQENAALVELRSRLRTEKLALKKPVETGKN
jgi:chemotaxis protein MotB